MQNCDEISWEEFYHIYWPLVLDIGRKLGMSQDVCGDLMQEIMIDLFQGKSLLHYDPSKGRFRTFFGMLVRHKASEMIRRSARSSSVSGSESAVSGVLSADRPGTPFPDGDDENNPFQKMFDEEYRKCLLSAAMNELRNGIEPKTYAIFEMVVIQGRSPREVARYLGVSRATIDVYCFRCRRKLQKIVSEIRIDNPDFELDIPL